MILLRRTALALIAAMLVVPAQAGQPLVYRGGDFAINGFDPVAYFTEGRPVAGSEAFVTEWSGAKWLFFNAENKARFEAAPQDYAPQYGGYCAYAVARGSTAPTDPDAWTVYDGKLYLNVNRAIRDLWLTNIPGFVASADANWPDVLN